jgi:hypothetical protein
MMTSPISKPDSQNSRNIWEQGAVLTSAASMAFAGDILVRATFYKTVGGLAFRTAVPLAARTWVKTWIVAGPELAAVALGTVLGGAVASNKLGHSIGLDHSLGHYVGLEWVGNQLGDLATSVFSPANPNGAFVNKADNLLKSFGLN